MVKSHGSADVFGFEQALRYAYEAAQGRVVQHIESVLAAMHDQPRFQPEAAAPVVAG